MTILLVEDNPNIALGLQYSFQQKGYQLAVCTSLQASREYLTTQRPQLVILDVMLPDGSGFDLYQQQLQPQNLPTIFLTARDDEDDIVRGLNLGAEDYMTKPFSTRELLARVSKYLRPERQLIQIGAFTFDQNKLVVTVADAPVNLTSLELKILQLLLQHRNQVVTRNQIIEKVWEWTGNDISDNAVTVYLKRIRSKVGVQLISTVKGQGYRIDSQQLNES
ncbi:response regulator transcription factor [Lapidilactobacillus wuchangensis]|uniref:response regulator transcription factor n=1 Tax=Lapidilactobacillus wuchangensis TaxID=2486001 RepID=UPI000F78E762|nr:response regulator transcription factor [Lapidilactobacillus wuchangensis]